MQWTDIPGNSTLPAAIAMLNENMRNLEITSEDLAEDAVTTEKIAGDAVGADAIAYQAVESAHIGEAQIQTAHIEDAAIGTAQIQEAAITNAKIDRESVNKLTVASADIADAAITNAKIDRESVNKLTVVSTDIADAAITNAKIDRESVNKLTVVSADIADAAITDAKIDRLSANKLTVTETDILDGAITNAKIDHESVNRIQITDGDIVTLSAGTISSGTLSVDRLIFRGSENSIVYELNNITGALQAENVDTLNGEVITPETITADRLVANTITAHEIATGTITADKLTCGYGSVEPGNIAAREDVAITGTGGIYRTPIDGLYLCGSPVYTFGSGNSNADEGAYFQIDLGETFRIAECRLYFYSGDVNDDNARSYWYKVKYSDDGDIWFYAVGTQDNSGWAASVPALNGTPACNPTVNQFSVPISARYVRVYGNGNTVDAGNSIYEAELYSTGATIIDGGQIKTNSITADKIAAGRLDAGFVFAGRLEAATGSFTDLTAGYTTPQGVPMQRVHMGYASDTPFIELYDNNGTKTTTMNPDSINYENFFNLTKYSIGNRSGLGVFAL